jgi:chondroitin AC lyase
VQSQQPDGAWNDIAYEAKNRMYWPPMEHLDRLTALAEAFDSGSVPEAEQAELRQAFTRGFDYWVTRDPKCSNWWYNEIGAPGTLYRLMLLTTPLLTDGRLDKGCALLSRAKLAMTGQNLVWLAENVIGRACLQRDAGLMAEAFKRIEAEIVVTEKEGIQPDFSFHQHGAQLYSGGYGNGFASSAPRFALMAQGTSFAFAPEKISILESYLLDGQQWMIRNGIFDYSASGREPTRPNSGKVGGYATNAKSLLKLDAVTRRDELERLAARIEKGVTAATPALVGHKHFWRSDYTVHHRPEWMVSVRLTSDRMLQTELVNEENQLGEHLSDGVMYLYRTGTEYRNIFPVWDWARLPGITVEQNRPLRKIDNRRKGTYPFAGGVSDGLLGVSAMEFECDGLSAQKAWFFFDGEVVCLGTDISSTNGYRVITSVNQCLADGPVTVRRAAGNPEVLATPEKIEKPAWAHHDGIGYVFLDAGDSIGVGVSVQTGSWKRVSTVQKADPVSTQVFSVWVNHGKQPKGATYAYAVAAKKGAADLDDYAAHLPVRLVANTPQAQAVEQVQAGLLQVAFYQAGAVESATWGKVSVDTPCLLLLSRTSGIARAAVCNPSNAEGVIRIKVGAKINVTAQLPSGQKRGASVILEL